jgi:hypothetical protein
MSVLAGVKKRSISHTYRDLSETLQRVYRDLIETLLLIYPTPALNPAYTRLIDTPAPPTHLPVKMTLLRNTG